MTITETQQTSFKRSRSDDPKMEYAWLEPKHDPIATDTNLAEIDFEDFRNEDLAYAFSTGDESGGSSTDMSICRSEALFSSLRDSEMPEGQMIQRPSDSLIQDSLIDADFSYSEQVKVNKNNYTLTFGGQAGSMLVSMGASDVIVTSADENNLVSGSPGKLTTWSNLGQRDPSDRSRSRYREENSLNNNNGESRKSRSLPDIARDKRQQQPILSNVVPSGDTPENDAKLVNYFMRNRSADGHRLSWDGGNSPDFWSPTTDATPAGAAAAAIPMMRSKDTVNQFLKTASRLTSIEEQVGEGSSASASSNSSHSSRGAAENRQNPPVPTPRQRSRLPPAAGASQSSKGSLYPDLSFLENDVGLWDAFFLHGKTSAKFPSILDPKPAASPIKDTDSLRLLLPSAHKHLVDVRSDPIGRSSPIAQVCDSLSRLHTQADRDRIKNRDIQNQAIKSMFQQQQAKSADYSPKDAPVRMVKVKEAWAAVPETVKDLNRVGEVKRRERSRGSEQNLNLINNNDQQEQSTKRRSYHPQDYLSQVLAPSTHNRRHPSGFPKSGSQNDLVDSWSTEEETIGSTARTSRASKNGSAEYPFPSMCMRSGVNFDLSQKRALFVSLYSSVERLLSYQDDPSSSPAAVRCILFHELCPALHAILEDGLKPEVITSFGRMQASSWRVIEAVARQGPTSATTTCDLVMLLNAKFAATGEDHRKFAGFVAGLLNMSSLHIWFSKLKWSMDVLLRFYERHAFICALHKETRLLFDELIFCLQRLYSIPLRVDMPFSDDLINEMPSSPFYSGGSSAATTPSYCAGCSGSSSESKYSQTNLAGWPTGSRSGKLIKSRIPRPISLPKRLEAKLGCSPSPTRSRKPPTTLESPTKPPTNAANRKSRVRDTIRLFDSRGSKPKIRSGGSSTVRRSQTPLKATPKSPKTGGGEAMVGFDSSGGDIK